MRFILRAFLPCFFFLWFQGSYGQVTLKSGLVMDYKLDGTLTDYSPTGNQASSFTGSWSADRCGIANEAANVSGNAHFTYPYNSAVQVQPPFSIHFYARFNSFSNPLAYYLFDTNLSTSGVTGYKGLILSYY